MFWPNQQTIASTSFIDTFFKVIGLHLQLRYALFINAASLRLAGNVYRLQWWYLHPC